MALFLVFLLFSISSCKSSGGPNSQANSGTNPQSVGSQAASGQRSPVYTPTIVGAPAPEITVYDPSGHPAKLSDLRGNVVIINFWATWCDVCAAEKPLLNRFYAVFRKYPHFRLLTVLYNDSAPNAMAFMAKHSYDLPFYTDPGNRAAAAYGLTGVPENYVVDKNGILRGKAIGPVSWNSPDVAAFIKKLLKE